LRELQARFRRVRAIAAVGALAVSLTVVAISGPDDESKAAAGPKRAASATIVSRRAGRDGSPRRRSRPAVPVTVSLDTTRPALAVPRSFFGISTEYWSLPHYEDRLRLFTRVLSLLQVPGNGPMVLRIGGDSADRAFWGLPARELLPRAFAVTSRSFAPTAKLVRRLGLRLILDLNLMAAQPSMAAAWARAAVHALPRGSVFGFEIGNEPDLYHLGDWYRLVTLERRGLAAGVPVARYTAARYLSDFRAYAHAISRVAPGIPLIGPAVANPQVDLGWITRLTAQEHLRLSVVSGHRYPLSPCAARSSSRYPTIRRLLSERSSAALAGSVRRAVAAATQAGLPFRLTELGSVTCRGLDDVSDTFATALWAPDALFELLRAGVSGVNLHVRRGAVNAPFEFGRSGLSARPLLYGMILFARMLGPGAQLVPLSVTAAPADHIKVWGVRLSTGRLHVLVINKGARPAVASLRISGAGNAVVQRLQAPAVTEVTGVTLAGQRLDAHASWTGRRVVHTLSHTRLGYRLAVPAHSAAMVTIRAHP
jgi:hypothetical protein